MTPEQQNSLSYIKATYGVPAEINRSIKFQGLPGVIVGGSGPYLKIRLDERPYETLIVHPTWQIDY